MMFTRSSPAMLMVAAAILGIFVQTAEAAANVDIAGSLAPLHLQLGQVVKPDDVIDSQNGDLAGADDDAMPFEFTIYWENDGGPIKPVHWSDRHYTNGIAISIAFQPGWADSIMAAIPAFEDDLDDTAAGVIFGQLMFTPVQLETPLLRRGDRPYAGYLFAGLYLQRSNEQTLDHFQIDLGLVGTSSLADELQKAIHDTYGGDDPLGWGNQLNDEFTFQFYFRKKWKWEPIESLTAKNSNVQFQVIPQAGTALGTVYRNIEGGATLRLGLNLPNDFGPGRLADVRSFTESSQPDGWTIYGFARATGRVAEHDMFVEGNNFSYSHGRDLEPLQGEVQIGVALAYHWSRNCKAQIGYSRTFLSKQFDGQRESDHFAALTLSLKVEF